MAASSPQVDVTYQNHHRHNHHRQHRQQQDQPGGILDNTLLAPTPALTCGYESPTEDGHLAFFTTEPKQQQQQSCLRPALVSRPSHIVAFAPPSTSPPNRSLNDVLSKDERFASSSSSPGANVSIKDRIACYQWTWFTMTMSTGGIANILYSLHYKANWILGLGLFFFLFNICLFVINCILISLRFYLRPGSFINSFTDQFVSIAIIFINICEYGVSNSGIWLLRTMEVMFWVYVVVSTFASAGLYLILWSTLIFPVHTMTPTWVFPAYPLLLTAPFAAQLLAAASRTKQALAINSTAVALCAATAQGTGCLIAFMISSAFVYRLMTQKLPRDMQRPGVFMSIGPFGFTAAGVTQLGSLADSFIPPDFLGTQHTVDIVRVVSVLGGIWLWGLAIWFFLVSVGSLWKYLRSGSSMPFQMTWWSFVFPNTALVTATHVMGSTFNSKGIQIIGAIMTTILIAVWAGIFLTMLSRLRKRKLLWPKSSL